MFASILKVVLFSLVQILENTQLERRGFSLKNDDDLSPNDRYGNILLRRVSIFHRLQVDFRVSV